MKTIIYQLLPRLFGNMNETRRHNGSREVNGCGKFADVNTKALKSIRDLGATHVWYTGVIRHATAERNTPSIVKGLAGSPYAITDYYDVDPDLAKDENKRMAEFEALVARTHKAGLKVVIDFVPNHVAREYKSLCKPAGVRDLGEDDNPEWAFSPLNNFYYIPGERFAPVDFEATGYEEFPAKATGNDCFSAHPSRNDWYETVKLNYGVFYQGGGEKQFSPIPNTWVKMRDILLFWAGKKVDAFRVDMAEMVPVEFWEWVIPKVKEEANVVFIAEVYNPAEYRNYIYKGHFDYLYDKVGLYDTVRAVMCGQQPASQISNCWKSVGDIQSHMLNFLENHDEQRIASDFFAKDARLGIPGMIVSAAMNTNPVMIYCGQELGEPGMDEEGFSGRDGRTTIFDYWSIQRLRDWNNGGRFDGVRLDPSAQQLRRTYQLLLNAVRSEQVITQGQFYDLMYANAHNPRFDSNRQYAFLRKYQNEVLLVVANFDRAEQRVWVNIPVDAFKTLGFEDNRPATVTDLLSGSTAISTLTDAYPYFVQLPAYSGKLLKFTFR